MAGEIASLIVRIGADANGLVAELGRADRALGKTSDNYAVATRAAGGFVAAAAAVGAAIGAVVTRATENADAMLKQAQSAGMATRTFSEYAYAARLSNLETEALSGAIARLNKGIVEAAQGGGVAGDAFRALGLNVRNADGSLKSADQVLEELADAFAKFNDEGPEKAALAIAIFGKAGAGMVPMLNAGATGLREMRERRGSSA